jgi:hypothetical protein
VAFDRFTGNSDDHRPDDDGRVTGLDSAQVDDRVINGIWQRLA